MLYKLLLILGYHFRLLQSYKTIQELLSIAIVLIYAFESGDGTEYEYYIDTDIAVSGDTDLGTIELTPTNASSKTMRICFVDADSGEILKISDIFEDTSYIGIGHSGLSEGEQFISGDFIDGINLEKSFSLQKTAIYLSKII